ncbi:MAG: tryptophan synthase subunit alpha [Candidatus Dojkabacteria bacterium]|nr:tryptophan synthase subunit alpha [Candidatus Dojkabacteria bacterium]
MEDKEHFIELRQKYNINPIRLLAPTSTDERIKKNAKYAKDLIYLSSRKGTTGEKSELDPELSSHINRVKKYIKTEIAVGYGISKSEHIKALSQHADIAVVGSAVVNTYNSKKREFI